jgi:ATP-dependent DNA helicase RecQ
VLLYTPEDVERQFGMSARSRLSRKEIQAILRSLRQLDRKKRKDGEVIATPGEILAEDENGGFERDSATDDTRVRTAVCWLEEARLLTSRRESGAGFPLVAARRLRSSRRASGWRAQSTASASTSGSCWRWSRR